MAGLWLKSLWRDDRRLRHRLLIIEFCLFAFWFYSVAYIFNHPAAKGSDGFEVFLIVPMTGIAMFLSLPALLLLISNRTLRTSAGVALAAIIANVLIGSNVLWNSGLGRGTFWPLW